MKVKTMLVAAFALVGGTLFGHDYDLVDNDLGDSRLMVLAGYTFARPISVVLLSANPTNGPACHPAYSVECQIVYRDEALPRPTDADWPQMEATSMLLNDWLEAFLKEACAGADAETLCANYANHAFVLGLQARFPDYVANCIAEMPPEQRIDVEAVTITVKAKGAFRKALVRRSGR